MRLSSRMDRISASPTLAIKAKSEQMKKAGIEVIDLGAGEPDFDTPEHIKGAAIEAIKDGFTKYTPAGGTWDLKHAVCQKLLRDNGLSYNESEVVISCGAKHSLFNIALALFEEKDEVIIPSPYWVSYPEQVKLASANPVIIRTEEEQGFMIQPELLEKGITSRTRALIVNSPSNPTGAIYDRAALERIAEIAIRHDIILISDECYEHIIYDGNIHHSLAGLGEEVKSRTLTVNAVSKTYSMTGWRIGFLAGPEALVKAVGKIQGQTTSNPTSISQKAAIAALTGDQTMVKDMVVEFQRRRDYIVKRLNEIPGVSCRMPEGAFYCFPNVTGLFSDRCPSPKDLTDYLLEKAQVAVVSGEGFGSDRHIRISYATSIEIIEKAMDKIEAAIRDL